MARTKLQVDRGALLAAILAAEASQPSGRFETRIELAKAVERSQWAQTAYPKQVTFSTVLLRIDEFGLEGEIATKKGKRGRRAGSVLSDEQKAAMQNGRKKRGVNVDNLRKNTPMAFLPIVDRIESGSLKAAIKMKCLECAGFQRAEVKACTVTSCPLHAIRPYK